MPDSPRHDDAFAGGRGRLPGAPRAQTPGESAPRGRPTLLALALAAIAVPARASAPLVLEEPGWFEDPSSSLGVTEVRALPHQAFRPLRGTVSAGYGVAPLWVRLVLSNPGSVAARQAVAFPFPVVERLDLFLPDGHGDVEQRRGGLATPAPERTIAFEQGTHLTWVDVPPGARLLLLLRVQTAGARFLGVEILDREAVARLGTRHLFSAMGLGALLALLGLIALRRRYRPSNRLDLEDLIFRAGLALHLAVASGLVFSLWALPPGPLVVLKGVLAGLSGSAAMLFLRTFLGTREAAPRLDRTLLAAAVVPVLAAALMTLSPVAGIQAVAMVALLQLSTAALACGDALRRRHPGVVFFLPGLTAFSASTLWYVLSLLGLVPPSPYVMDVELVGATLIGISSSIAIVSQDNFDAGVREDGLAVRVAERTRALSETVAALRAEAAARAGAEGRFETAFRTFPGALSISRLSDGLFLSVNPGFLEIHGLCEEQVLGHTADELGLWSAGDWHGYLERLRRGEAVRDLELQVRGGAKRTLRLTLALLDLGGVKHVLCAAQDVTEARSARAARARLEEELRRSQKLEAVGRLAAGVSHDFNNLLTAIGANVGLSLEGLPADQPERAYLQEAADAVGRAAQLTRQLLAFTRKQAIAPRLISVGELVSGMGKLLERLVGEKARLSMRLAADLPPVRADAGQLEQVILNLVVNARDAVREGGSIDILTGLVDLPAVEGREGGPHVRLAVVDDGVGMDAETRRRLFEPFFTTKAEHGTGLGLATVHGIVQQHRGLVIVDSAPGRGSTFEVLLPAALGDAVEGTAGPATQAAAGGSGTVLVVEDSDAVRAVTRAALCRIGYRVLAASGGTEALALAKDHGGEIDLLLTDARMPGLTGPEVAARLRADRPRIRVLFMTGHQGDPEASSGLQGQDVLEKPFTVEGLGLRVREALARPVPPVNPAGGSI